VPTLRVATRDYGEAAEIRVWDNSTGIPSDIRDKLFQPFFTTKPTGEGTGLGLSITYDIVTHQHGGTIAVASEVGEYSEFTIHCCRATRKHLGANDRFPPDVVIRCQSGERPGSTRSRPNGLPCEQRSERIEGVHPYLPM
jgi:hypothetical protein